MLIAHSNNIVVKPYLSGYGSVMHINSIIPAGISHLKTEYDSVFYSWVMYIVCLTSADNKTAYWTLEFWLSVGDQVD